MVISGCAHAGIINTVEYAKKITGISKVHAVLAPDSLTRTDTLRTFAKDSKNTAWNLARSTGSRMGGTIMTNLGRLDYPETYGSLRLDRIFVAPCASETVPLILAGAGVSGMLTFTANFVEQKDESSQITTREMIQVRNRALEYIGFHRVS